MRGVSSKTDYDGRGLRPNLLPPTRRILRFPTEEVLARVAPATPTRITYQGGYRRQSVRQANLKVLS